VIVLRILIAEDDPVNRELLSKVLAPLGDCETASDGIETVEAVIQAHEEDRPFDVLCLDIMMPRVDGIMALRAIRDAEKHMKVPVGKRVKVIILSALNEEQARATGLDPLYEAYMEKPLDLTKLYIAVEALNA